MASAGKEGGGLLGRGSKVKEVQGGRYSCGAEFWVSPVLSGVPSSRTRLLKGARLHLPRRVRPLSP